jgi:hypothetical protein
VFAVRAHEAAVGGHELDRAHVVGRESVRAAEEADPAAERVADDADVGGGARQRREPMLGCGLDDLEPNRPRLDAGGPASRIDRDSAHPLGPEQDRVLERVERPGVVSGALRRDPLVELAREQNSCRDIQRGLRKRDGGGPLVDR